MRYIIYGAGAIGGVIGARLAMEGHDVVLIARGAHLAAIQRDGLRFKTPVETFTLAIPAVSHPSEIEFRDGDVVVLAMKSQDTAAALDDLRLVAPPDLPVVCCQNGVENERLALRRFRRVYGQLVILPATYLEAGVVESIAWPVSAILDVGCYPQGVDAVAEAIAADLEAAGLHSVARSDIMRWKYAKLYQNMQNAPQAICGPTANLRELVAKIRAEAEAVLAAAGIDYVPTAEYLERQRVMLNRDGSGGPRPAGQGSSTWQSLVRGTGTSEVDYLNGEIALLARLHGVSAPANEVCQAYAERMARQRQEPGSVSVEELERQIALREAALSPTL